MIAKLLSQCDWNFDFIGNEFFDWLGGDRATEFFQLSNGFCMRELEVDIARSGIQYAIGSTQSGCIIGIEPLVEGSLDDFYDRLSPVCQ